MIVWNGAPRGASDSTKEFADLAEASGFRMIEVPTLGDLDEDAAGLSAGS
jgi:hypothetical protein